MKFQYNLIFYNFTEINYIINFVCVFKFCLNIVKTEKNFNIYFFIYFIKLLLNNLLTNNNKSK